MDRVEKTWSASIPTLAPKPLGALLARSVVACEAERGTRREWTKTFYERTGETGGKDFSKSMLAV